MSNKKESFHILLSETEKVKLKTLADQWGESLSTVIRTLIREYREDGIYDKR